MRPHMTADSADRARTLRRGPRLVPILIALLALLVVPHPTVAQQGCDRQGWDGERICEVRQITLAAEGELDVDASPNGGIQVEGRDRDDVSVRAIVHARADSESRAREILGQIEIRADGTRIRTEGPRMNGPRDEGWHVNYRVLAPRSTDLQLESTNGGLDVTGIEGDLDLDTTNGGISLAEASGGVRAHTTNGGIDIRLSGSTWRGSGLDAHTTNGGIRLTVPDGFAARLEAETVHGDIHTDFPITVQGRIGKELSGDLNGGGPTVRLETTNGGISIRRQ